MRKIIYGSFSLALLASLGMTLFTHPASASEEFVAKMKQYAGRILSLADVKKVLTGNTVVREITSRRGLSRGRVYEVYWHYKTAKTRELSYSVSWRKEHVSKWFTD
ncbi:MAG: hypothetical protein O6924_01145, partial [Alphaproteobacteria bacterium]|nr:hypothetical protein [Alphaproteobacteria bacterium]